MIRPIDELRNQRPRIDLTGPDGNSFALMGSAKGFARQLGIDHRPILDEMRGGDYENLIRVFDHHFGEYVDLYR